MDADRLVTLAKRHIGTIAIIAVIVVTTLLAIRKPNAPLTYADEPYYAQYDGNTLVYTPTITINRDGRVSFLASLWNLQTHTIAAHCDGTPVNDVGWAYAYYTEQIDSVLILPKALVIGRVDKGTYVLAITATKADGGETTYKALLSVDQPCRR